MSDPVRIPIFISSTHYGLEDLRGELAAHLSQLGTEPLLSSESGFPDHPGVPPYVGCLQEMDRALIVIGVLDRRYGQTLKDWAQFPQYGGLSPTHAELRHALARRKRTVIFVRSELQGYYDIYRKNKKAFGELTLPANLEIPALELYAEMKRAKPAPWIEAFRDVRDIKESIRKRLLQDLHEALLRKEKLAQDGVEYLFEQALRTDRALLSRLLLALSDLPAHKQRDLMGYLETLVGPGYLDAMTAGVPAPPDSPPSTPKRLLAFTRMMALAA